MRHSVGHAGILALAIPTVAFAAPTEQTRFVSLPAQPLAVSLQAVAKRFGIELLFSQDIVAGRVAPAISGRVQVQQALDLVLSGSSLVVRKTADGSYVIAIASIAKSDQPEATPDILVIGRRTQNTDIRRTENDVRPYQVVTRQDIARSHVATIEELAAKRLPANAQGATLSQQAALAQGETASSINLRGLGTAQTLILVDGRRLPQMPDETAGFLQSDVNALAPEAIDRVEAITATAGGIYGPGATAGVVNLVIRRDYRGIDLAVTGGITARGDAPYRRVDLRLGFTPDHGATDVMIDLAQSNFAGLDVGARDFLYRANARSFANDPADFLQAGPPVSASINVMSSDGSPLVFKPGYGGAALGSPLTYAAPADGRSAAALAQTLRANAGRLDLTPSGNATGGGASLLSGRKTSQIIASVRHRFGGVELFADYLRLANTGHARTAFSVGGLTLNAANPANPFVQAITIVAPDPDPQVDFDFRTIVARATVGAIVDLPGGWRGEGDYSRGSASRSLDQEGRSLTLAGFTRYYSQFYSGSGPFNPLADYSAYLASFDGLFGPSRSTFQQSNRYTDASLRLAGPIVRLNGGNLTATVLAEQRSERVSGGTSDDSSPLIGTLPTTLLADYAQITRSLYGEARAPLVNSQSGFWPLRGLEVQLAVRYDSVTTQASQDDFSVGAGTTRSVRNAGTVFTAGFKVSPISGVLLRGSISTGEQPLTVTDLSRRLLKGTGLSLLPDPKRGNLTAVYIFDVIRGGPPDPQPEKARTLSAGIVFQPAAVAGLRVSLDYTHITKSRETVSSLASTTAYFVANEALYPDRVTRAPLTPADAALGYTGGLITQVDASGLQIGTTTIDAVDGQLDYRLPIGRAGTLDFHAAATWQPRFERTIGFGLPNRDFLGAADGAPAIRGNAGVVWNSGPFSLSMDGQVTGGYRITSAIEYLRQSESRDILLQGGTGVPAQATLDLGTSYRFTLPGSGVSGRPRTVDVRFGIQDVLDSHAATVVNAPGDYNVYADPRRRRFELTVAAGF